MFKDVDEYTEISYARKTSFGSDEGVQVACLFFTLCETCKNFCINFKEYVAYAAKELISGNTDYESLAPWAIKFV